jgi:hypothetical protein
MQRDPRLGTYAFNPYAAGAKQYGANGASAPTSGPVDPTGYIEREANNKLKRNIMLQWMQNNSNGAYGSADAMRRG